MTEEIIELTEPKPEPPAAELPVYRYAMVDPSGVVVGVIMWNGEDEYEPEEKVELHQLDDDSPVGPGWALRKGKWVDERSEPEETD